MANLPGRRMRLPVRERVRDNVPRIPITAVIFLRVGRDRRERFLLVFGTRVSGLAGCDAAKAEQSHSDKRGNSPLKRRSILAESHVAPPFSRRTRPRNLPEVLGCIVGARAANKTPFFGEVITSRRSQKLADHRVREQAVAGKDAIADDDERIEKSGAPCCFADRLNLGRPLRYPMSRQQACAQRPSASR